MMKLFMVKEGELVTYRQLADILTSENGEAFVPVSQYNPSIIEKYEKVDMLPYAGERIFVREEVARKLAAVATALSKNDLRLKVVYGYRHPEVQENYFNQRKDQLRAENPSLKGGDLDEATHYFVAVPTVAGHPTGGAVDLTVTDASGKNIDMGMEIADYKDPQKMQTFARGLTSTQEQNRKLLHDLMKKQGFAPFYGEWWHFSYGDREWAYFYGKSTSIYGPTDFHI